ncbi:SdrD B-like domain-containing protein [Amycolatopsis samaneae]|uniref:SdrD B-like domain-containing protein n=1 Tax=Amycolatopsis samaneae TaxID=664691 RepID=A0ABW5GE26_9PSEU
MRRAASYLVTLTAAAALTGVFAAPAGADPAPVSTAPSSAPSTAPSSSAAPAPEPGPPSSPSAVSPKPAAPDVKPAQRAQVEVSLAFDKPSYRTDEDVRFTIKLKNTGEIRAAGLWVSQSITEPTDLVVPYDPGWGPLKGKPGVSLDPGATYELGVSGKVRDIQKDTTVVRGVVFDETGFGVSREFKYSVPVTKEAGHAAGTVFGDRNGNGTFDTGEQLAGAKLTLRYIHGNVTYSATSDAAGKFAFDLPAADYYLGGEVVNGWLIPFETVHIGPDTKDLLVRGAPPLNGALRASMAFTQRSYKAGDLAHVTVTLSNSGPIPLTGIVAACNRVGDGYMLSGRGAGWGDLASSRGVTIAPGQTRTFDVSETVPEAAVNRGYVQVACDFGYAEVDIFNHANADDRATVPGAKGAVIGEVSVHDATGHPQQGVGGVKVVLVAEQDCPIVGEQTTDANGHFEFHGLTPGLAYRLFFLTPQGWRIKGENPTAVDVRGPEENPVRLGIRAEAGDAPQPAVPAQPATCGRPGGTTPVAGNPGAGSGQGGGAGLASTGVDAATFGACGLAVLAIGAGLVLAVRRRHRSAD